MGKRLKASEFPPLNSLDTNSNQGAVPAAKVVTDSQKQPSTHKKESRAKVSKKEPFIRGSYTLTQAHLDYIDAIVERQKDEGLNANSSHFIRQLVQAEMKRNPIGADA